MALLKPSNKVSKEQIRLSLDKAILDEIQQYCQWAGLDRLDDFVEQASRLVMRKDREWQHHRTSCSQRSA